MTSAIEIFNSNGIKYRTVRDNQDDLIVFYIHYEPFEYESTTGTVPAIHQFLPE